MEIFGGIAHKTVQFSALKNIFVFKAASSALNCASGSGCSSISGSKYFELKSFEWSNKTLNRPNKCNAYEFGNTEAYDHDGDDDDDGNDDVPKACKRVGGQDFDNDDDDDDNDDDDDDNDDDDGVVIIVEASVALVYKHKHICLKLLLLLLLLFFLGRHISIISATTTIATTSSKVSVRFAT
uniref:Uncharacterized protein n=1 Tax=Glossina pallidipes TaxID=7398 RepID=A0A1A9ZAI5_GLOPL